MKFHNDCADCQRLWRTYSNATVEHIQLEERLQIAMTRESDQVAGLALMVDTAAQRRSYARQLIMRHEQARHQEEIAA